MGHASRIGHLVAMEPGHIGTYGAYCRMKYGLSEAMEAIDYVVRPGSGNPRRHDGKGSWQMRGGGHGAEDGRRGIWRNEGDDGWLGGRKPGKRCRALLGGHFCAARMFARPPFSCSLRAKPSTGIIAAVFIGLHPSC